MRAFAALALSLCLAAGLVACKKASSPAPQGAEGDMSLGSPNAKVQVIEYASLGCPICAKWNNEQFQTFKAKYIDSGKVHYTLREFLTGDQPVAAAGFLLARCVGKDKYFDVVDAVWRQEAPLLEQADKDSEKRDAMIKIAESAGLSEQQFQDCVNNDAALNALNQKSQRFENEDHISSTPTFVINGKAFSGSLDGLDAAVAAAVTAS